MNWSSYRSPDHGADHNECSEGGEEGGMETVQKPQEETREEAIARILRAGRPALSREELYGPGPGPDDPEDLETFLALLDSRSRRARAPDEEDEV